MVEVKAKVSVMIEYIKQIMMVYINIVQIITSSNNAQLLPLTCSSTHDGSKQNDINNNNIR